MDLPPGTPVRLNLGAGARVIEGWLAVDVAGTPDVRADIRSLPFDDESVDEAMAIHVLEHLPRWESPKALREWFRVLKPGALLAIEVPDLLKCCQNAIDQKGDRAGVWGLYGDPVYENELMCHRWCYSAEELSMLLREAGFGRLRVKAPHFHKKYRDMRIEAIR